jgi:histidyl-tRNA synthetase
MFRYDRPQAGRYRHFTSMEWNLLAAIIPIMMQKLLPYYGII